MKRDDIGTSERAEPGSLRLPSAEEPTDPGPMTIPAEALAELEKLSDPPKPPRCGRLGFRAGSYPCGYARGHGGPCGWDS